MPTGQCKGSLDLAKKKLLLVTSLMSLFGRGPSSQIADEGGTDTAQGAVSWLTFLGLLVLFISRVCLDDRLSSSEGVVSSDLLSPSFNPPLFVPAISCLGD